ncbi:MAG: ATP-dependent zinc metalloprotease FtsH [Anaerolineales bacterium]|jgi:cell division protease FtsH
MDNESKNPKKSKISPIWWIILIGLIAWNVFLLIPRNSTPSVDLPYSVFLTQVKDGNVKEVKIVGSQITGTLNKAITWPPPTQAATPQATPQATVTAVPGFGALQSASTTPQQYTAFSTTFPATVGDSNLMPLLRQENVQINVSAPSTPWFVVLLTDGLPILLLVLIGIWIFRSASQSQSGIFNFSRSKARRLTGERTGVTFSDVAGADEAKQELTEVVDFLREPLKYHLLGAHVPHGVLLVGPPGTGKTLMARAIAGEAGVPFFSISASEFVEMFVGVGASRVRDLFNQAKAASPAIVYIDELDAVGRRRGAGVGNVNDEREQTLNQLLVEMDGFDEHHETIVLASTNRPDVLDPAILRPGRFDRQISVGLPDRKGREGILRIHTRELRLAQDVDLHLMAQTTTGFSGADLANLCNEAALIAARNNHREVNMADFEEALDRILLGATRALLLNDQQRRIVAYHEAGHALVAWLTLGADPVHKVTIIPHGQALGVTEQMPLEDQYNYTRGYLMARLAVMLGGRASEEIALDDITTGAENDLVEATRLARRMVTRWGMGSLGNMAFDSDGTQPFLGYELSQGRDFSEQTAAKIDRDVQKLLSDHYQAVKALLEKSREKLDALVEALLKEETIDQSAMVNILGPRNAAEETIKPLAV